MTGLTSYCHPLFPLTKFGDGYCTLEIMEECENKDITRGVAIWKTWTDNKKGGLLSTADKTSFRFNIFKSVASSWIHDSHPNLAI